MDPAYLKSAQPRALKFYYQNKSPYVFCSRWKYDPETRTVGTEPADSLGMVSTDDFRQLFIDILNYHTVVLGDGETLGTNKYYKTKHGGAVMFDGNRVLSGSQIEGVRPVSNITQTYNQANGKAYAIDRVIEPPHRSVLNVLQDSTRFREFYSLCNDVNMDSLMEFANDKFIQKMETTNKETRLSYHPFASKGGLTENVNYFNSYNYTVYAPDDAAMAIAYQRGLPTWNDIKVLFDKWYPKYLEFQEGVDRQPASTGTGSSKVFHSIWERLMSIGVLSDREIYELQQDRDRALAMVEAINAFVRYHFQDNSIFADIVVEGGEFPTACADTLGIRQRVTVAGGNGRINVTDANGQTITVDANNPSNLTNRMTRDYVITTSGSGRNQRCILSTSSFAVVHQVSTPLSPNEGSRRYDDLWTGENAPARLKAYRKLFEERLYKRYTN